MKWLRLEMARPTKFTPEKGEEIALRLRNGNTRKASAESVGIIYNTFLAWLRAGESARAKAELREFREAVTHAEAEAEIRNVSTVERAAAGIEVVERHESTKTVFRTKKTKHPDGTVVEEPVALEERGSTTITRREIDWRAALEWLKRRRRSDWGDAIDIRKLSDEDVLRLLEQDAVSEAQDS